MDKFSQFHESFSFISYELLVQILGGVVVIVLFWLAGFSSQLIIKAIFSKLTDKKIIRIISKFIQFLFVITGIIAGLNFMGINIAAIIASLGLTGFALGFALKDIISNYIAGILILLYKPFKNGDTITVSGCKGKVREINMRYTILEGENESFMIPNSLCFSNWVAINSQKKE
jgi:small-conductance mechanosensitive channel